MIYYFDTSALLKRYLVENGSPLIQNLFDQTDMLAVTSAVAFVEGYHGICRKYKNKEFSGKVRNKLLEKFQNDLNLFKIVDITSKLIELAQTIVRNHVSRTLDAVHVASALFFKQNSDLDIHFVSSNATQNDTAKNYGLLVLNPLTTKW